MFTIDCSGVSNFFSCGARLKTAGAPRFEAEGFTEVRSAERGRVGEGVTPSHRWGSGASPWKFLENCPKMVHSGVFWSSYHGYCKFQNRKFI